MNFKDRIARYAARKLGLTDLLLDAAHRDAVQVHIAEQLEARQYWKKYLSELRAEGKDEQADAAEKILDALLSKGVDLGHLPPETVALLSGPTTTEVGAPPAPASVPEKQKKEKTSPKPLQIENGVLPKRTAGRPSKARLAEEARLAELAAERASNSVDQNQSQDQNDHQDDDQAECPDDDLAENQDGEGGAA